MRRTAVASSLVSLLSVVLFAGVSAAQSTSASTPATAIPGAPAVRWFNPFHVGDTLGSPGDQQSIQNAIFEPLRLELLAPFVPRGQTTPGCSDSLSSAGAVTAASPGFAPQYATALRLVPRLTLYGFTRGGCAVDTAVGGGAVYAAPVTRNVFLVGSAGYIMLPQNGPRATAVTRSNASINALIVRDDQTTLRLGVGRRGVSFGGTF